MKKLDDAIDKFFNTEKKITLKTLFEEVEKVVDLFNIEPLAEDMRAMVATEQDPKDPLTKEFESAIKAKDIQALLPVIKITEAWGSLGERDRRVIEKWTANLGGEGNTVQDKLKLINTVTTGKIPQGASISQILTTMMVIETLNAILGEFTESAGGFIFEGFLAGLFGGQSVQIETAEDIKTATGQEVEAAGKPITDVVLAGKHYSLKLLGQSTAVKGSFKNMVEHFKSGIEHVIYLDARRSGDDLHFSEFEITLPTFLEAFYEPFAAYAKKTMTVDTVKKLRNRHKKFGDQIFLIKTTNRLSRRDHPTLGGRTNFQPITDKSTGESNRQLIDMLMELPDEILMQLGPFEVSYSSESYAKSDKAKQLFGPAGQFNDLRDSFEQYKKGELAAPELFAALERTPAYRKQKQFSITPGQVQKIASYRDVGTLSLGEESLKSLWTLYAEQLIQTIAPVYFFLNMFTQNINSFFLSSPTEKSTRFDHGSKAIAAAEKVQKSSSVAVKKLTPSEDELKP